MQLGPTRAASWASSSSARRARTGSPSGPDSMPRPGTTKRRAPAASASSMAATTFAAPGMQTATSGRTSASASRGTHASSPTWRLTGCTPTTRPPPASRFLVSFGRRPALGGAEHRERARLQEAADVRAQLARRSAQRRCRSCAGGGGCRGGGAGERAEPGELVVFGGHRVDDGRGEQVLLQQHQREAADERRRRPRPAPPPRAAYGTGGAPRTTRPACRSGPARRAAPPPRRPWCARRRTAPARPAARAPAAPSRGSGSATARPARGRARNGEPCRWVTRRRCRARPRAAGRGSSRPRSRWRSARRARTSGPRAPPARRRTARRPRPSRGR